MEQLRKNKNLRDKRGTDIGDENNDENKANI